MQGKYFKILKKIHNLIFKSRAIFIFIFLATASLAHSTCTITIPLNPVHGPVLAVHVPHKIHGRATGAGPHGKRSAGCRRCSDMLVPLPSPYYGSNGIPGIFLGAGQGKRNSKDPFCFPSMGIGLWNSGGILGGTHVDTNDLEQVDNSRVRAGPSHHLSVFCHNGNSHGLCLPGT